MDRPVRATDVIGAVVVLTAALGISGARAVSADPPATFAYLHDGALVTLEASARFVVVADGRAAPGRTPPAWRKDRLSRRSPLRERSLRLYRSPDERPDAGPRAGRAADLLALAAERGLVAQPVFELGDVLRVPTEEVIVRLDGDASLDDARRLLDAHRDDLGLRDVRPLRRGTFVVRIDRPAGGRAFAVSRALAAVAGVVHAQPNCVVVRPDDAAAPGTVSGTLSLSPSQAVPLPAPPAPRATGDLAAAAAAPPGWTVVLSQGFEGDVTGWVGDAYPGAAPAAPGVTAYRAHAGSRAVYMTGYGFAGVPPPGPYPALAGARLWSPALDLGPYEEAYVELWFHARYETPAPWGPVDYGRLLVVDPATGAHAGQMLAVKYTGDLTADPTTAAGWRRALFRVPAALRHAGVKVVVDFQSDAVYGAEGLYVDDVRVVGAADVDTQPLGSDPYAGRQWELRNAGQIAGLGGDGNDLHVPEAWALVPAVSPDVVIAIIDEGVDLLHPDLNLVTGYDAPSGAVGGGPKSSDEMHGTACAGNAAAIRDNGIGVAGTAAGAKVMPIHVDGTDAGFAVGIDLAVEHGARVLGNSWALGAPVAAVQDAVDDALAAGRSVVFSAGNGPDRPPWTYDVRFPASLTATRAVIAVGASSPTDEYKGAASSDGYFGWSSSYGGAGPDVVAPGPWSYTTDLRGSAGYNADAAATGVHADYTPDFGGTSSSAPKVAGVVALMLTRNPALTPLEVKTILRATATDIDAPGIDDRTGAGRVDALAAVLAAAPALLGDCDADGQAATLADVQATIDVVLGRTPADEAHVARCDTTCDDAVDLFDVLRTIDAHLGRVTLVCPPAAAAPGDGGTP